MASDKVDFFFVGYPKSGSTTMYYLLKSHPEIFSPDVKEFNFFNSDHTEEAKKHLGKNYFRLVESEQDYFSYFRKGVDKLKGDFTPINILSKEAPHNIFEYNPYAKIIVSVREPVAFLRSIHFQMYYNLIENEPDFLRALSMEKSRRAGKNIPEYCANPSYLFYSDFVEYKKHIQHYTDIFGFENVKILLFDDIVENEVNVYQETLRFLCLKDIGFIPPEPERNPSHALRFSWLRKIMFKPYIKQWLYKSTPQYLLPVGARISQKIFKKKQEKPFVSNKDIERLKMDFSSKVFELDTFFRANNILKKRSIQNLWGYE